MKRPIPNNVKINSLKGEKVFSGERFDVYQWKQKEYDGSEAIYETVKKKDSVCIIPVVGDVIYLVKECHPHWAREGICLISGGAEDGEELEAAARRELQEETGMEFKNFYMVGIEQIGFIEWFRYVFIATGYLKTKEKKLDPGEKSEVLKVSFDEFIKLIRTKGFLYQQKFIEDFAVQDKVSELLDIVKNPEKYVIK